MPDTQNESRPRRRRRHRRQKQRRKTQRDLLYKELKTYESHLYLHVYMYYRSLLDRKRRDPNAEIVLLSIEDIISSSMEVTFIHPPITIPKYRRIPKNVQCGKESFDASSSRVNIRERIRIKPIVEEERSAPSDNTPPQASSSYTPPQQQSYQANPSVHQPQNAQQSIQGFWVPPPPDLFRPQTHYIPPPPCDVNGIPIGAGGNNTSQNYSPQSQVYYIPPPPSMSPPPPPQGVPPYTHNPSPPYQQHIQSSHLSSERFHRESSGGTSTSNGVSLGSTDTIIRDKGKTKRKWGILKKKKKDNEEKKELLIDSITTEVNERK